MNNSENMGLAHNEESGTARQPHSSVFNNAAGTAGGVSGSGHRSSIVPAGSVAGSGQDGAVVVHPKDDTFRQMSTAVPNLVDLTADASAAAASERRMGFREAVRLYPKAVLFSLTLSLAIIMEGYDTALLTSFFAMSSFQEKYGQYAGLSKAGKPTYQLHASWQNALNNSTTAAQIIGLLINGFVSERIGYRWTMIGALFAITCFIFLQFFAVNVQMLLAAYIMTGLPW